MTISDSSDILTGHYNKVDPVIGGVRKTKTVCCFTDADWAICAGNWMWISSSAFEGCLSNSFDSRSYG